MCVLERACWFRCRVPPQGAAQVRMVCALWSWPAGAAAGYCCKLLLFECCVSGGGLLVPLQSAAAGCGCRCRALITVKGLSAS